MITALRTNIRELGWRNGLVYVVACALERVTRDRVRVYKYHFVAQPVPPSTLVGAKSRGAMQIGVVTPDDPILAQAPVPPAVVARRFAEGARCIVARSGEELAGYLWLKTGHYDEDEVRCTYVLDPPNRAAWDFDVYVAPAHRLGRTFVRLWESANALLRSEGYRYSLSRISAFKAHSLASHGRLGTIRLFSGTFLVIGPLQIALFGVSPYLHVAGRGDAAPRLRVSAPDASTAPSTLAAGVGPGTTP